MSQPYQFRPVLVSSLLALTLAVVPSARALDSCTANERTESYHSQFSTHSTWLKLDPATAADAPQRLLAILPVAGYTVVSDAKTPGEHVVTARLSAPGQQGSITTFRFHDGLGVVHAHTVTDKQNNGDGYTDLTPIVCGVTTVAAMGEAAVLDRKELRRWKKMSSEERRQAISALAAQNLDWLYGRVIEAGLSLVVMPVLNVDGKYKGASSAQGYPPGLWADLASLSRWEREGGGTPLLVGHRGDFAALGMTGSRHSFVADNARYLVYIVNPGRYSLTGSSIDLRLTKLPEIREDGPSTRKVIGSVTLEPYRYPEYYREPEWKNAEYQDREYKQNYCSLTIVGGPCVQWSNYTQVVTEQTKAAGYYDAVRSYMADGLKLDARSSKPIAHFDIAPGEVALVDGFYAQHPSTSFNENRCKNEGKGVNCNLTEIAFVRIPAKLQDLSSPSAMRVTERYPTLRALFGKAAVKPVVTSIKADALIPGLGQLYVTKE